MPLSWCTVAGLRWHYLPDIALLGQQVSFDSSSGKLYGCDVYARLSAHTEKHWWSWSRFLHLDKNTGHAQMRDARLSLCHPQRDYWYVQASSVDWDKITQSVTLHHPSFYFLGWRWLSLPYYHMSLKKTPWRWQPAIDYRVDDGMRFLLHMKNDYFRFIPYISSKSRLGIQGYLDYSSVMSDIHFGGQWSLRQSQKRRPIFYYYGHYQPDPTVAWRWQWMEAQTQGSLSFLPGSIFGYFPPSKDVPRELRWTFRKDNVRQTLLWRHFKRFSGAEGAVDTDSLPQYNRLPSYTVQYDLRSPQYAHRIHGQFDFLHDDRQNVSYPLVLRWLGYASHTRFYHGDMGSVELAAWYRGRYLDSYSGDLRPVSHLFVPKVAAQWRLLQKDIFQATLLYRWSPYVKQAQEPVLTTDRWYWRDDNTHFLAADRGYDEHWLALRGQYSLGFHKMIVDTQWQHRLTLSTPRVFLSTRGEENPYLRHPYGITHGRVSTRDGRLRMEGLWSWHDMSWEALHLGLYTSPLRLVAVWEPGFLYKIQDGWRIRNLSMLGFSWDILRTRYQHLYASIDYYRHNIPYMRYRLGWRFSDCGLHIDVNVSGCQALRNMDLGFFPST